MYQTFAPRQLDKGGIHMSSLDFSRLTAAQSLKFKSKTKFGFLLETEIGEMEATCYAKGIFRIRLGSTSLNDYGILTGGPIIQNLN
jgi:hypothetical protein